MSEPSVQENLVGVDGCRAGWLAVCERGDEFSVELWPNLAPLFEQTWTMACVDIPVGLLGGNERRECDTLAREILGRQRSSVFFAPPREHIGALDYDEVRQHGMSLQTFHLLPKIRQMDALIKPEHQSFLREAHPELSYRTRSEKVLDSKKNPLGQKQRQELLQELESPFKLRRWESGYLRRDVALDDFLDAAILLEVAREWSWSEGHSVGGKQRDSRGLKMEICY
jgi:predicted RNase H-like nuclease